MISIIIPVHNAQTTIERCVESLITQSGADYEIILVENGSIDKSAYLCQQLADKYKSVKYMISDTTGVSHARNIGLMSASGEIIGFCDADDYYEPDVLEYVQNEFLQSKGLGILITGFNNIIETENKTIVNSMSRAEINKNTLMKLILNESRVMGSVWNKFYSKELLNKVSFCEELSYCEDTHFNISLLSSLDSCYCLISDIITYNYVINGRNTTTTVENFFDSHNQLKYINSYYRILSDCILSSDLKREIGYAIVVLAINTMRSYHIVGKNRKNLKAEICKHYKSFLYIMWSYPIKLNLRRNLWIIKEMIKR